MFQRLAFQELHGDKRLSILLPDVIDRADVRVIQGGGGLRLALEASQSLSVSGNLLGQELQGDETTEPGILGLEDHTHPAAAQPLDDSVVGDGLADHGEENPEAR